MTKIISSPPSITILSRRIPIWAALLAYLAFMLLVYSPLLLGQRFFWEDFFIRDYPIRDYSYYASGIKRILPFWNPYTWNMPAFLADAEGGFWYPGNLLQIVFTRFFAPNAAHIPEIIPEIITILHLPLAAFGIFYLLKKEYKVSDIAALIGGFMFGFGTRIIADQNHPVFIYQLSLFPWEILLLIRSWKSWRSTVGFGLIFGLSYLAGQPQVFLFLGFFFACFTMSEIFIRLRERKQFLLALRPAGAFALALVFTIGTCAIQLLPTLELVSLSARAHLTYQEAARFGLHPAGLLTFLVPRVFPEFSGFVDTSTSHMQPTFYWSAIGEILALFAIVSLWRSPRDNSRTRYLCFFVLFSLFALAFSFGEYLPVHLFFWKFIPFFDKIRAPARMLWLLWFIGTIYGGIGLEMLLSNPDLIRKYRKLFIGCAVVFFLSNLLVFSGILDRITYGKLLPNTQGLTLPSLIISVLIAAFIFLLIRKRLSPSLIMISSAALILVDLFYLDFTQHQNTLSREKLAILDNANPALQAFFTEHAHDHSKLWRFHNGESKGKTENTGMIMRKPIEDAIDIDELSYLNQMRMLYTFPPVADSIRRMEIMGIAEILDDSGKVTRLPHTLPFVKIYHTWQMAALDDSSIYQDSNFDFTQTIVLKENPGFKNSLSSEKDTVILSNFSENRLQIASNTESPAILFINDLFDPAWQCKIDGKDVKIIRAFTSLRAIPIPAGSHNIEMEYRSSQFEAGWKISAVTIFLGMFWLVAFRKKVLSTKTIQDTKQSPLHSPNYP